MASKENMGIDNSTDESEIYMCHWLTDGHRDF